MLFQRLVIVALGFFVLSNHMLAQSLSSEQSVLNNEIVSFLKDKGLKPETGVEGVIGFEYDGCRMVIRIDPQEVAPMFVTMAAIFELPNNYSPQTVLLAAKKLNAFKGIKVLTSEESFSVQTDMFLTNAESFTRVFQKMISQIQITVGSFAEAYSNASSDKTQAGHDRREGNSMNTSANTSNKNNTRRTTEGVYYNPKVSGQLATDAKIKRVVITEEYTCVELSSNSTTSDITAEWCNIDSNTYIVIEDKQFDKLKLVRASGIKLAPDKTYYGGPNRSISFKLYFPPIPKDTRSISLIEPDSSWCFYGITLHQ